VHDDSLSLSGQAYGPFEFKSEHRSPAAWRKTTPDLPDRSRARDKYRKVLQPLRYRPCIQQAKVKTLCYFAAKAIFLLGDKFRHALRWIEFFHMQILLHHARFLCSTLDFVCLSDIPRDIATQAILVLTVFQNIIIGPGSRADKHREGRSKVFTFSYACSYFPLILGCNISVEISLTQQETIRRCLAFIWTSDICEFCIETVLGYNVSSKACTKPFGIY
jgi:hypothetical protein